MYFSHILIFWVIFHEINLARCAAVIDICNLSRNTIYAAVGSNNIISTWEIYPRKGNISRCTLEIIACPACIIFAKIWLLELTKKYNENSKEEESCGDDHLEIAEPPHRIHSRKQFCYPKNQNKTISKFIYRSQTRGIKITLHYSDYYAHPFTVECTAKHNIRNLEIPHDVFGFEGTITSPFFPIHYPADYRAQYNIKCSPKIVQRCRIKVTFLDYQLAPQSLLEFFEGRNKRLSITTGRVFRPPIIISNGRLLSINFHANRATSFGFKFNYTAVLGEQDQHSMKPETTCGGYIKDLGGTIAMSRMAKEFCTVAYDCIWILRPQYEHKYLKTHLYVKVVSFYNMEKESKLEIYKGLTSSHRRLQLVSSLDDFQNSIIENKKEHVESINTGFYIHLRGIFNSKSRLAISYSAFSFSHSYETNNDTKMTKTSDMTQDCYLTNDFLCHNQRCIAGHLHCDGFDNCGDNSDESYQCARGEENEDHLYRKNYYFPVIEPFSNVPVGFIISFCTAFMIFMLCSLMCTLIYRMQHHSELNNTMATQNLMSIERPTDRNDSNEVASTEPPPQYEYPPNYNEIMEMEMLLRNQIKRAMDTNFPSNESKASCSHSYISHTRKLFSQHSSSDEDSSKDNETPFKRYAVFRHSHSEIENLVHSAIRSDFTSNVKCSNLTNIKKKKPNKGKVGKKKFEILSSKSTSNLILENINQQPQIRLSKSVNEIPLKL